KKGEQLTSEQIQILKDVALTSPTATNSQGWHFSFIENADLINMMEKEIVDIVMSGENEAAKQRTKSRNNKVIYDAPLLIVISMKPGAFSLVDAGIAVQSLALAAKGLGLESAILGMTEPLYSNANSAFWHEKTMIPEGYSYAISIAIGYGNMAGNDRKLDYTKISDVK
ncbi:MAG: nitroreductase family protein, partial [Clostridiales bacterium]|nr:nitroreductase family protein [Clostridiales bacterium]